MDRRRMIETCGQDIVALQNLLARNTDVREVVLAMLELSAESRTILVRILRRVAAIEAARGPDAAEAAVQRVIAILARGRLPSSH